MSETHLGAYNNEGFEIGSDTESNGGGPLRDSFLQGIPERPDETKNGDLAGSSSQGRLEKPDGPEDVDIEGWDLGYKFRTTENDIPKDMHIIASCIKRSMKGIKVLTAVLLMCIVLASTVISKGSVLYIAAQINTHVNFKSVVTRNSTSSPEELTGCGWPVCLDVSDTDCIQKESVRWIWAMFLCQCVPYFHTFVKSFHKLCFKKSSNPSVMALFVTMIIESLHTVGLFVLMYIVIPKLDVYRALLICSGVGCVPSVLALFNWSKEKNHKLADIILNVLAFLGQWGTLFLYLILHLIPGSADDITWEDICTDLPAASISGLTTSTNGNNTNKNYPVRKLEVLPPISLIDSILIIASLLFISSAYWENFVDINTIPKALGKTLLNIKNKHYKARNKLNAIVSIWKIILTFSSILLYFGIIDNSFDINILLSTSNFYNNTCGLYGEDGAGAFYSDWLIVAAIQIFLGGLLCWLISVFAIRGHMQLVSFTIPLYLSTPVTCALFYWACSECHTTWDFGSQFYWNCMAAYDDLGQFVEVKLVYIGIIWYISMILLTRYIIISNIVRIEKIDRIFTQPRPCGILLEPSIMLIRRRIDEENDNIKPLNRESVKNKRPSEEKSPAVMNKAIDGQDAEEHQGEDNNAAGDQPQEFCIPILKDKDLNTPFIYMCATLWHENKKEMLQILKSLLRVNSDQCAIENAKKYCNVEAQDCYKFEAHIFFDDAFTPHNGRQNDFEINDFVKDFVTTVSVAMSHVLEVVYRSEPTKYVTPYGGRLEWQLPFGNNKLVVHLKDKQKIRNRKRWSQIMYLHYILGHGLAAQKVAPHWKKSVSRNTYILALDGDTDFQPEAVKLLLDLMRRNEYVGAVCGRIHPIGGGPMVWYQKFEYSISHWLQKATEHMLGCVLCSPGCFSLFRAIALMDDNMTEKYSKKAETPREHIQYDQGEDRWLCTLLLQQGYRVEYSAAADAYTYAPTGFDEFFNQRRRWITSTFANILDLLSTGRETAQKNENISMIYIYYQWLLMCISVIGPGTIFMLIVGALDVTFGWPLFATFFVTLVPILIFGVICYVCKSSTQLLVAKILSAGFALLQMLVLIGVCIQMVEDGICSPTASFFLLFVGSFLFAAMLHPQEFFNILHGLIYFLLIPCMYLVLIIYSLVNLHVVSWGTREVKAPSSQKEQDKKKANMGDKLTGIMEYIRSIGKKKTNDDNINEDSASNIPQEKGSASSLTICVPNLTDDPEQQDVASITNETPCWINNPVLGSGDIKEITEKENTFWKTLIHTYLYPLDADKAEQKRIAHGLKDLRDKAVFTFFFVDMLLVVLIMGLAVANGCDKTINVNCTGTLAVQWVCSVGSTTYTSELDPIGFAFIFVFGFILVIQVVLGMLPHRVFTFLQVISATVVCQRNHIEAQKKVSQENIVELMKQLQKFDAVEESADDSDDSDGSDIDKVAATIRRASTTPYVYTHKDIHRKMSARIEALSKAVNSQETEDSPPENRRFSRRQSRFQSAIKDLQEGKNVSWSQSHSSLQAHRPSTSEETKEFKRADKYIKSILKNDRRPSMKLNTHELVSRRSTLPSLAVIEESSSSAL